ncbi:bifunctional 3,4-dihydroxy-2-butanone-4-phosphate synthase/GTP cyclohydrolase II [Streptomyces sp. NPDC127084]|uniref:bifunctional 3,4-dihydroxy-2-butanone-4-phosphate synthase/GTP cyclohydrolase II n=1 Tax=Streptomyces sp. NPDC127084 TaxID=3347133 RepID=UPI00364C7AB5
MSTAVQPSDCDRAVVLNTVERAIADMEVGRPVIVVDDESRENEGDLVVAAEKVTPEIVAFMMAECRGLICVAMAGSDLDRLGLPPMVARNTETNQTAFTVSVDASSVYGVSTGISAADRSTTIRLLASGECSPESFTQPGHVFPLRARSAGVLARNGHTEAGVDLAMLAGLRPAAAIVEIANQDGTMARLPDLVSFAREHDLTIISIEQIIAYRRHAVRREAEAWLPTAFGDFRAYGYRSTSNGVEHIALVVGDIGEGEDVLVRVHSQCLTGDVFHSLRCDCEAQLQKSLARVASEGRGVVLYLRDHEGRGIGLLSKLRAYELQERGRDTLEANVELGLPVDARDYGVAAQMLADLGVRSLRLLTNNPDKSDGLARYNVKINSREPVLTAPGEHNLRYLRTKRDRMAHDLPWLDAGAPTSGCDRDRAYGVVPKCPSFVYRTA